MLDILDRNFYFYANNRQTLIYLNWFLHFHSFLSIPIQRLQSQYQTAYSIKVQQISKSTVNLPQLVPFMYDNSLYAIYKENLVTL